jgi:hypothetical protein
MRHGIALLLALGGLGTVAGSAAQAQVIVSSPVVYETYRPVVTYSPVVAESVVTYSPVVTESVASYSVVGAPTTSQAAFRPAITYYSAPVATTTYYAPTTTYYAPTMTYYTPTTAYYAPTVAYAAPSVIVSPKVYVRGQPIRNILRAITP